MRCSRNLDPFASSGGAVSWAGDEIAPVWFDLAREYTEKWHHQMHIREAVGALGLTSRRYLHPVQDTFVRALPHAYRDVRRARGHAAHATDHRQRRGGMRGRWPVRVWPGASIRGRAMQAPRRCRWTRTRRGTSLRKGSRAAEAREHAQISGDVALGEHLLSMVSIIA